MRYAYSLLGDRHKAEDAVQETMMRIWLKREQWQEIQNMEGFAMRIIRNVCVDSLRKENRVADMSDVPEVLSNELNPLQAVSVKEMMQTRQKAVQALPEIQQMCFFLREEGKQYNEISHALNISLEQVKVNIFRARNSIKTHILKKEAYGTQ